MKLRHILRSCLRHPVRYGACAAVLAAAVFWLPRMAGQSPAPPQETAAAVVQAAPLPTSVEELQPGSVTPVITSEGTVSACDTISVTSQVSGVVKGIAPCFEVSSFVPAGEVVLELDGTDFEAAITAARAQLAKAESALALEETRSSQARLNWEELGYADKPGDLVLRIPQLGEAKAAVESAAAQLARARRDLERTKVRVPFACRVLTRTVSQGQTISTGTALGTIAAADRAWVRLPIPMDDARLLPLPETSADPPLPIELRTEEGGPARIARIIRTEPQLEAETGALLATAAVDQPYRAAGGFPPLRIGQKVTATIRGPGLSGITAVPREAVSGENFIQVVSGDSSRLIRRAIEPLWSDSESVFTRSLTGRVLVATGESPELEAAPEGTPVRIVAGHSAGQ